MPGSSNRLRNAKRGAHAAGKSDARLSPCPYPLPAHILPYHDPCHGTVESESDALNEEISLQADQACHEHCLGENKMTRQLSTHLAPLPCPMVPTRATPRHLPAKAHEQPPIAALFPLLNHLMNAPIELATCGPINKMTRHSNSQARTYHVLVQCKTNFEIMHVPKTSLPNAVCMPIAPPPSSPENAHEWAAREQTASSAELQCQA